VDGFVGNFKSTFERRRRHRVEHGVAVMATGARPYEPMSTATAKDPRVLTSLELDQKADDNDPALERLDSAVFIQCVGSREPERPYCSRVCCTHSIETP
jgi:heterodisulfide reductase subunit A